MGRSMRSNTIPLVAALTLAGCGDSQGATTTTSSSTPSSSVAAAPQSAPPPSSPKPAFQPDPEIVKLVKAIAAGCALGDDGYVRDCKAGEEEALLSHLRKNKPAKFFGTVADLALGEGKGDKRLFGVATYEIGLLPTGIGDDWYKTNGTEETIDLVLKAVEGVEASRLSRVGPGVAAVGLAGGHRAKLVKFLDARPEKDELRRTVVSYWIRFGGVDALADLEHFAASTDPSVKYNASWSIGVAIPGPFGGAAIADDAKQTICEAGKKLLSSADDKVFQGAAESMGRCKGAFIDAALDALEKRDGGATVPKNDTDRLYHLCWGEGVVGAAPNGTKEQCGRALGLLESIATREGANPEDVFLAVFAARTFARDVPDLAPKAQALRDKFKESKDKRTAEEAKKPIK